MSGSSLVKRRRTWLIGIPVLIVLAAIIGPFVYINFIEGEPSSQLTFDDISSAGAGPASTAPGTGGASTASGAAAAISVDGNWAVASGSQAGYRVAETLFGQKTEAVGRTSQVSGSLTIAGTQATAATVTVDLASVASDSSQRDGQFRSRIMDVSTYPTAQFVLSQPLSFGSLPADGTEVPLQANGNLSMHGTTKATIASLVARRNGSTLQVTGTIPVTFADYGIPNPSFGPATVGDTGTIEFALAYTQT